MPVPGCSPLVKAKRFPTCSNRARTSTAGTEGSAIASHQLLRVRDRLKAELRVEPVRIPGAQQEDHQALEIVVSQDGPHERLGQPLPAVLGQDEYVGQVGEHRTVGNHAGEADLAMLAIYPETE